MLFWLFDDGRGWEILARHVTLMAVDVVDADDVLTGDV